MSGVCHADSTSNDLAPYLRPHWTTIVVSERALSLCSASQGTLQSIEGQPLDNQFVLATHALTVTAPAGTRGPCNVQLFSLNGQYRFAVSLIFFL